VSIIKLPLKHNSYISTNCGHSIIQEASGIIRQGLKTGQSLETRLEQSYIGLHVHKTVIRLMYVSKAVAFNNNIVVSDSHWCSSSMRGVTGPAKSMHCRM